MILNYGFGTMTATTSYRGSNLIPEKKSLFLFYVFFSNIKP